MSKYALISVSDKSGVETLAKSLSKLGFTILSTSGTAVYLRKFCPELIDISELTGFPEILDGRVKTLHPKVHAGILADRTKKEHLETLAEHGIKKIDLVAVNLYPFAKTREKENVEDQEIIENIDIGGPSLLRAAAKNHASVTVLCDPTDYSKVINQIEEDGETKLETRRELARKAFEHVRDYDAEIADYFLTKEKTTAKELPPTLKINSALQASLRYGENPHQQAGIYAKPDANLQLLHGQELSFNNHLDIAATLQALRLFEAPAVVIVKHCNPCGIGIGVNLAEAYQKAFAADTQSPFGGIVGLNRPLNLETAKLIDQVFAEIIIAPDYEDGVLDFLRRKKKRRLIQSSCNLVEKANWELKDLPQGWLLQSCDHVNDDPNEWKTVTQREPDPSEREALAFAWKAVSLLRSNAIAIIGTNRVFGLGAGQTSRIDALHLALWKAQKFGHDLSCAVCASDGFFPFRDSIDELHSQGIRAIVQPGGSKGDQDVIAACDSFGIAMLFTGIRHFRH